MIKIIENPKEADRRIRVNELESITTSTIPGCSIDDRNNYFSVRVISPRKRVFQVYPENNLIRAYDIDSLQNAILLAKQYEAFEKNEWKIEKCYRD